MNTSIEERKAIAELALKKVLYSFPISGSALEVMFEFRGKVKQDRLNRFVELLEAEFSKHDVYLNNLKTEESSDLFETILKKATETRSDTKRIGFKNILLKGLRDNKQIDYCEIFAELLLVLKEVQLEILAKHSGFLLEGQAVLPLRNHLKRELQNLHDRNTMGHDDYDPLDVNEYRQKVAIMDERVKKADSMLRRYETQCVAKQFSLTGGEYDYFVQDLVSKGLLYDDGVGAIGTRGLEIVSITELGLKFLSFIHGESDSPLNQ